MGPNVTRHHRFPKTDKMEAVPDGQNEHDVGKFLTTSTVPAQLFSPSDGVLNVNRTTAQIREPALDIQLRE